MYYILIMENNNNEVLKPISLLRKSYWFISDVLTRNIGEIEYTQHIKNIDDVHVLHEHIGDVVSMYPEKNSQLLHFIHPSRLKYNNYYEYALNLNPKIGYKGLIKHFDKNNIDEDILFIENKEYGTYPILNDENIFNPLFEISDKYISYVDALTYEKENNDYVFGVENDNVTKVPHQLTNGYNYDTFYNTTFPKISGKYDVTDTIFEKVSLNFVNDSNDYINNLYHISFDDEIEDKTNLSYTDINHLANEAIYRQKREIKNRYGRLLRENIGFRTVYHNGKSEFSSFEFDSKNMFNDVSTKVYAEAYNELEVPSFETNISEIDGLMSEDDYPTTNQSKKSYLTLQESNSYDDLVSYTNQNFRSGKIKTIVSRFGSFGEGNGNKETVEYEEYDSYHTAVSSYGTSHGRNLLKSPNKRTMKYGAYNDPYCRVWTTHHQYQHFNNLIRPFAEDGAIIEPQTLYEKHGFFNIRTPKRQGFDNGMKRLAENSVLDNKTNLVRITPVSNIEESKEDQIKKCMFSIENLAWKGVREDFLSEEQRGPLGGRIMWFPPYDIKFSEAVNSPWQSTKFIGRGEPIYTYTDTERTGNLSFKILIDHPAIVNWYVQNSGSVIKGDQWTQDGEEYNLLRFFAGCDIPEPYNKDDFEKRREFEKPKEEEEPLEDIIESPIEEEWADDLEEEIIDTVEEDAPTNDTEKIIFMVFYPNNYTGNYEKSNFDPIVYLINGIGAQKYNPKASSSNVTLASDKFSEYTDIPTNDDIIDYTNSDYEVHGYEMNTGEKNGVTPKEVLANTSDSKKPCSSITLGDYVLVPQKNTKHTYALSSSEYTKWDWWYRVDERTAGQWLTPRIEGHSDRRSYGLNSHKGLQNVLNAASSFNISDEDKESLYSLSDVFVALNEHNQRSTLLTRFLKADSFSDETKVEEIKTKLTNYKVISVETCGMASSHGVSVTGSNQQLMNDRASAINKWLQKMLKDSSIEYKNTTNSGSTITESENNTYKTSESYGQKKDESELLAKLGRSAKVIIELKRDVTKEVQNTLKSEENEEGGGSTTVLIENEQHESEENNTENMMVATETTSSTETFDTSNRYDDEYRFFHEKALNDPFLRHEISEKIKYFDPAFHAITPEGFNARLTFLHQCTRQGPTIGNSEGGTANNLAFGRQPVCVLRIGDFYNTKIVIESLQIDYDNQQWDLNPEGIGVQPMSATISIGFKFLGGSDLTGPIGRLQNAVSFNYYANTSVYDDRSEMIDYKDKDISNYKPFDVKTEQKK